MQPPQCPIQLQLFLGQKRQAGNIAIPLGLGNLSTQVPQPAFDRSLLDLLHRALHLIGPRRTALAKQRLRQERSSGPDLRPRPWGLLPPGPPAPAWPRMSPGAQTRPRCLSKLLPPAVAPRRHPDRSQRAPAAAPFLPRLTSPLVLLPDLAAAAPPAATPRAAQPNRFQAFAPHRQQTAPLPASPASAGYAAAENSLPSPFAPPCSRKKQSAPAQSGNRLAAATRVSALLYRRSRHHRSLMYRSGSSPPSKRHNLDRKAPPRSAVRSTSPLHSRPPCRDRSSRSHSTCAACRIATCCSVKAVPLVAITF